MRIEILTGLSSPNAFSPRTPTTGTKQPTFALSSDPRRIPQHRSQKKPPALAQAAFAVRQHMPLIRRPVPHPGSLPASLRVASLAASLAASFAASRLASRKASLAASFAASLVSGGILRRIFRRVRSRGVLRQHPSRHPCHLAASLAAAASGGILCSVLRSCCVLAGILAASLAESLAASAVNPASAEGEPAWPTAVPVTSPAPGCAATVRCAGTMVPDISWLGGKSRYRDAMINAATAIPPPIQVCVCCLSAHDCIPYVVFALKVSLRSCHSVRGFIPQSIRI